MKKIIIGVIAREITRKNKKFYGTYYNYLNLIIKNNATPLIIPPFLKNIDYLLDKCDGILAPGGDDVTKEDRHIYEYAYNKNIPYLGICLGMQAMSKYISKIDNHYLTKHNIIINKNSTLYKIYKKEIICVNSRHHYKIDRTDMLIGAIAVDGIIEAIECKNKKFIIGVQWHPEDMNDFKLFKYFIESCL